VRVTFKLPAVFARRRCLFGHLQRLEDEHGGALVVAPRSRSMRPAWPSSSSPARCARS